MNIAEYQLRRSKKAKYLQLRLSPRGLEVVVPSSQIVLPKTIEAFVAKKRAWIEKKWQQISVADKVPAVTLPMVIELNAIDQIWQVNYVPTKRKFVTLLANHCDQITLMGNIKNQSACFRLLNNWLKKIAYPVLHQQLSSLAKKNRLTFNQLTIRNTSSRWGSCTRQKNISLSCKLLFLSANLMQHVLLHELCHTKVMNHSEKFWQLLLQLDSNASLHHQQLKTAQFTIPAWTDSKLI